jgi:hypothetical protein
MDSLDIVAPAFVEMAHRIVWATAATVDAPSPVGYDPTIVPGWESPTSPNFGILRVEPMALRVMDGSRMVGGAGRLLTWADHA